MSTGIKARGGSPPLSAPGSNEDSATLAAQAFEQLETLIVTLQLVPGSFVTEGRLVEELRIGRTPVREALQRLAAVGLLEIQPRRGIRIADINLRDQIDRLEVRRGLEVLVAKLAAQRATGEQRQRFRALARSMRQAAAEGRELDFMAYDSEFHHLALAAADNRMLSQTMCLLHGHARRFWYAHRQQAGMRQSARLHTALMLAIARGDVEQAQERARRLMRFVDRFTRAALLREDAGRI